MSLTPSLFILFIYVLFLDRGGGGGGAVLRKTMLFGLQYVTTFQNNKRTWNNITMTQNYVYMYWRFGLLHDRLGT